MGVARNLKIEQDKKDAKELGAITRIQGLARGRNDRTDVATVRGDDNTAAELAKTDINTKMDGEKEAVTAAVEAKARKIKAEQEEINNRTQDTNNAKLADKKKIVNSLVEKTQKNIEDLEKITQYKDIATKLL